MNPIAAAKTALRKELKIILNSLSSEEKARQSKIVQKKLFCHELYQKSQRISIFLSMHDEIQTTPILQNALGAGKTCFIPRYDSKTRFMDMVRLQSWEEYESLPVTKWQIKQPPLSKECEEALTSGGLDLILMPGLAFTAQGHRMGRGRGYYDTYLSKCRASQTTLPHTIALAFKEQVIQYVPTDDSDIPIDIVLSAEENEVMVVDSIAKDCGPCTPYQPMKPKFYSRHDRGTYIPGVPVAAGESRQHKPRRISLGMFNYRAGLRHIAAKNFNPKHCGSNENELREVNKLQKMMKEGLTSSNYVEWFQTMLWLEEMQMEIDIQYYTMPEARLGNVSQLQYSKAQCVELEVLGLAENRPSVLRGDSVFVTHLGTKKPVYEGVVHQVNEKSIYLAFDSQFMSSFIDNLKVSVEFTFNRYPLRVSHRAAVLSKELSLFHLTFPVFSPGNGPPTLQNILPYNRKIQNNLEQMEAVSNIVAGTSRPSPYIIFGPPGTGKTVTVVEAIKQVYKLQPLSRVLAAAPSNAAADLIARRLQEHVSKNHMHRFHAQSRPYSSIPNELLDISNVQDRSVYLPNDDDLKNFRIIICTFVTAARIASASFPPGHITHVFLDECGHSMEPECIAALAGIIENDGQVVLAGDPHQLGPVIRNQQCFSSGKHFSNNGLDKSYLERLMEREMYQPSEGQFNRKVVTKLLNNYRSHKDILTKSNEMFYDNELKVCADQMLTMSLCNWEHLPKRNFPLIFHAVRGKDEREGRSPSFFNTLEVSAVIDYTKKLLDSRNPKIMPKEIGIITPYRRQVEKIKQQLTKAKIGRDVKVGSPEEFQGDERRVIIISSVRASADQLADDQIFKLGFLRNPKRFNVAVTRAKALLILVGCPEILHLDEHWGKLLDFIRENGGYRGAPLMKESQDLDDILARFDNLNLRPVLSEEVSARELAEAPEWRVEY